MSDRQSSTLPASADLGLLAMRLMLGAVFVFHGSQKLFGAFGGYGLDGTAGFMENLGLPLPYLSALSAGLTEFLGGLGLAAGVLPRLSGLGLTVTMLVASFSAHAGAFSAQADGMEYPLTLAVVALGLALTGPGALTLGGVLGRPRREGGRLAAVASDAA